MRLCPVLFVLFCPLVLLAQDRGVDKPLPPEEAARAIDLPPGFTATLLAGEPDLVQPMAFTFDDRGRAWVVESLSYPTWKAGGGAGSDRVTIFEDADGDGRHDKRTVFYDRGLNLSGIEVGFGGVWLTAVPNLIFIPDANADDQPDGPPQILLDGWDLAAKHNVVGNMAWGPDGWLYGCNGILSNSKVGKPGTAEKDRTPINCGVWRYHPVKHAFEAHAHGTTNPWGLDWDERGQLFITNCVIKHLFHVLPGSHMERMFGQDINPHSYGLIESCADHKHWAGGHWTESRGGQGAHGDAGGGHAHSGCMIYLGDNWPAEYRGHAFTLNTHGQRLNRDMLERHDSGYVAKHATDLAFSRDPWFRGVAVKYGPDGGVYISDWSDTGECHDYNEDDCDKTGGRIFKIVHGQPKPFVGDLQKLPGPELVALQAHPNEWHARHARRVLQERAANKKLDAETVRALKNLGTEPPSLAGQPEALAAYRLRALFTWHATGMLGEDELVLLLESSPDEALRAQAAVLAVESRRPSAALLDAATSDTSAFVRLHIAAALQRVPLDLRWRIAQSLLSRAEDADDAQLSLMIWYAVEPLVSADPRRAIGLLPQIEIPLVRQYVTRRSVAVHEGDGKPNPSNAWVLDVLFQSLATADDAQRRDMLRGLADAYRGRRAVAAPPGWAEHYAALAKSEEPEVRDRATELAVLFGDRQQIARLQDVVMQRARADLPARRRALELLVAKREPEFGKSVLLLLREPELRADAIRALAAYDTPEIAPRLLALYPTLDPAQRGDAIQTLTARPAFALALLDAIAKETIPRQDVSALIIRQLQSLGDPAVSERLAAVWGDIRPASADKRQRTLELKSRLEPETLKLADLPHGRALFAKNCGSCHKLFDEGGRVGPELTGSQRTNLDYVLDNVLDPSAIVPRDYKANILRLADGRIVQGVIVEETPQTLVVQTANETVRLPTADIDSRKESALSMMPEGLLDRLTPDEVRDLVAYLASPQQVPVPK